MYQTTLRDARTLSDEDLVRAFETLELDPSTFRHVEHVRLAVAYLRVLDLPEALAAYRRGLRALAAHHGAPEKYHETVTCGLLVLIAERMAERPEAREWPGFAAANPDLLRWLDGAFFEYYDRSILDSPVARRTFVLPGRKA